MKLPGLALVLVLAGCQPSSPQLSDGVTSPFAPGATSTDGRFNTPCESQEGVYDPGSGHEVSMPVCWVTFNQLTSQLERYHGKVVVAEGVLDLTAGGVLYPTADALRWREQGIEIVRGLGSMASQNKVCPRVRVLGRFDASQPKNRFNTIGMARLELFEMPDILPPRTRQFPGIDFDDSGKQEYRR
jgi:hypothetical protein